MSSRTHVNDNGAALARMPCQIHFYLFLSRLKDFRDTVAEILAVSKGPRPFGRGDF
jgi:hypothetical protein